MERVYPNRLEAAHLIGLVNKVEINSGISSTKILEQQGVEGAELVMDEVLRGLPGERRVVRDGSRRRDEIAAYRQLHREPRHGYNVLLTIDQRVQHIVEQEADRLIKDFSPEGLQIVVVRPKTGAILALTNRPTFDPSDRKTVNKTSLRNRSLTDVFEPGSTFKIVTLTAALNERIADLNTEIFCEYGRFFYGGHWLRDTHPHGNLKVRETFAVSSNIAFAKLAMVLGERKLYNYIRKFGFGRKAQISTLALPGEEGGILRRPALWNKISITRIPMGHEIAVTTLQMTMAMAAIANDGMLMTPQVVSKITDQHGKVRRHFPPQPAGRVCDPEVAKLVRRAAMEVIFTEKGTGGRARLKSFTAGGKTGTANKIKNGQYSTEFYTSSFVGFVPMEKPEFVITVVVDSPQGSKRSGGYVAAPAFRNIARLIAEELNLSPSQPDYRYVLGGNS